MGIRMKSYSATWWWSKWEVMEQLMRYFGDVEPFLEQNQDVATRITNHLRVFLADEEERKQLLMKLSTVVDVEEPFVKATYIQP